MKPVVICRYAPQDGPGYFATYLTQHSIDWCLVKLDEGDTLPDVNSVTGLAMMGGPMSVNDELPWLTRMLSFVRDCIALDVPVIGHCLGGQLLSKALGGVITRNAVKEIGWAEVQIENATFARQWGPAQPFVSYHWHGETFSIPPAAIRIWSNAQCANQAFIIDKHIGMQCHIEMTDHMICEWCETGAEEIELGLMRSPAVQTPAAMRENMTSKLEDLHRVADRVYGRWITGLR
jgi:GMP synthase-like glutamine amidotransferase